MAEKTLADMFTVPIPTPRPTLYQAENSAPGLLEPGNLDLLSRPIVRNRDGTISTVKSMSINEDGKEVLIPLISKSGVSLSPDGAVALYRWTGQHLGKFSDPATADAYANALHRQQENFYGDQQ
jgi:hypothetical protein